MTTAPADRRRTPVDTALDMVFFAPIGLLASCRRVVPELAAKGRTVVDQQVSNARVVGRFALQGLVPPRPAATRRPAVAEPAGEPPEQQIRVRVEPAEAGSSRNGDAGGDDELAIPQYDSLAASQVVARLDGLTAPELDAVHRYELAHRGRKTVLGKIDQLRRR